MRALILAAGQGRRLGHITKNTPKPMLEVGGRPVLDHIITRLEQAGIDDIIIKVSYLREQIMDYFGDRARYYRSEMEHDEAVWVMRTLLEDDNFFVINGDTISNVDYKAMIRFHAVRQPNVTVLMDKWRCAGTWLYSKEYYDNISELPIYRFQQDLKWNDIGEPRRLLAARKAWHED